MSTQSAIESPLVTTRPGVMQLRRAGAHVAGVGMLTVLIAAILSICALVLIVRSIKIEDLLPLVPSLLEAIRDAQPGEVRQVSAP